jgi:hypothetical protein
MNESFWDRFPKTAKIHCIEMKNRAQARIAGETRGMSADQLFAYFHKASQCFGSELGRAYPKATPTPMAVRESGPRRKRT